jgi:glycosyltransferase involved in cell wall biosynthesis
MDVGSGDGRRPRALLVSTERPWPRDSGVRQRLGATLDGLTAVADVDLFSALPGGDPPAPPAGLPVRRLGWVADWADYRIERIPRWLASGRPRSLVLPRWEVPAEALRRWLDGPYDVAWYLGCPAFAALPDVPARRFVLDVDDLPHQVLRHRRASRARSGPRGRLLSWSDRLDERRWARLFPQLCRRADVLLVCSELDRARVGPRAAVLPNGYDAPAVPARRRRQDGAPVLALVGGLDYPPNADAAEFTAREVLPRVRAVRPDAQLWVIGTAPPATATRLGALPGVRVRGRVEDVSRELAEADVALAPLRYGGGTRIKILEAFAHRVPVVTTTVGCEGLDVADGVTVLIADDGAGLADACLRLLADPELRSRLTRQAASLQESRYRWHDTRTAVADIAAGL